MLLVEYWLQVVHCRGLNDRSKIDQVLIAALQRVALVLVISKSKNANWLNIDCCFLTRYSCLSDLATNKWLSFDCCFATRCSCFSDRWKIDWLCDCVSWITLFFSLLVESHKSTYKSIKLNHHKNRQFPAALSAKEGILISGTFNHQNLMVLFIIYWHKTSANICLTGPSSGFSFCVHTRRENISAQ